MRNTTGARHPAFVDQAGLGPADLARLELDAARVVNIRAFPGAFAYVVLALGFSLASEVGRSFPRVSLWMTLAQLLAGALRLTTLLKRPDAAGTHAHRARWRRATDATSLLSCALYGLYVATAFRLVGVTMTTLIMMTASAGLVVGIAHALSPKPPLMYACVLLLLGLPVAAMLTTDSPTRYGLAALMMLFLAYVLYLGQRLGVEYWQSAIAGAQLEIGRDELLRSQRQTHDLIETMPDAMGILTADSEIVFVNPAWTSLLGYEASDLIGKKLEDFAHPEDTVRLRAFLVAAPAVGNASAEFCLVRRDQTHVTCEIGLGRALDYEGRQAQSVVARDVTERNLMRSQLLLSERLVSIGVLAAGVAHEINNPLTFVLANLQHAESELRERGSLNADATMELAKTVAEALEGAERVRLIVRDLKTFSRVDDDSPQTASLDAAIDFAIKITANEVRHRARIERVPANVPLVVAHEAKLGQVFVNLLLNAAYAIPEGHVADNTIRISARMDAAGDVLVEVGDTGGGISPANLSRIFDPFFTTKPVGLGTGLGLSICHANMRSFGGDISVTSEVGLGTTFTIRLLAAGVAKSPASVAPRELAPASRGRALVVDDENGVATALKRILARHCEVVVETSAASALARLEAHEAFDVVFCDLMMPNMTGMELHDRVMDRVPEYASKFVFMTGGAFTPAAQDFLDRVPNVRLDKPFDMKKVRRVLTEMLAAGRPFEGAA